ncbi:nitroreductase/quinone reductase family protein [Gordonia sp. OPL2]|uniref:nitroreductase/quinone reductase family protein n=1 Tax=Gordonia sp. OPL2 TaxID=2486274 RepID=UPI0016567496|nr:nitroreductase/quinone reductase family protein [Gordonia sp. OPL2]RPA12717.1 nitroreductase family deazaflavin-dependent oxidoreductase [Gordonia sp. OPL2]
MKKRAFVLLNRVMNAVIARLRPRRFRGADLLLLTTTGRRSGEPRTTPLIYTSDGDRWIVVASNGGADWEPGWWLNLRAGAPATVDIGGTVTPVIGTELTGDERATMWSMLNDEVFDYQNYQDKVHRTIAVVALTPAP